MDLRKSKSNILKRITELCDCTKERLAELVMNFSTMSKKDVKSLTRGEMINKILSNEFFNIIDDDKEELITQISVNDSATLTKAEKVKLLNIFKSYFQIDVFDGQMKEFVLDKYDVISEDDYAILRTVWMVPEIQRRIQDFSALCLKSQLSKEILLQLTHPARSDRNVEDDNVKFYIKKFGE